MRAKIERRRVLAAAVTVVLVGLAIAASSVLGSTSEPAPSLPVGDGQGAQAPGADYRQIGPALSDEQLARVAANVSAKAGVPKPGGATVVSTTLAQAVAAGKGTMGASTPGEEALMHSSVSVVVLHGSFTLADAPVKRGYRTPSGTVLTLTIDSHSGWVDARELTDEQAPGLAKLGNARALSLAGPSAAVAAGHASFTAEVHINRPETHRSRPGDGKGYIARVSLIVSGPTGRREMTVTSGRRVIIRVAPGTYSVSAQIGPPVVNPVARACGRAKTVLANPSGGGFVRLICGLAG